MWTKIENNRVQWEKDGRTEIYDEAGLRHVFSGFLSNESRNRYGGENFCTNKVFYQSCLWFMEGLGLFFNEEN